jgi:hypothetical protein
MTSPMVHLLLKQAIIVPSMLALELTRAVVS